MKKKVLIISILILIVFSGLGVYKLTKYVQYNLSQPVKEFDWGYDYKAEDFFDNPKVVEFCHSIKSEDYQKADELLKEGVDINTEGKRGMTPFLWTTKYVIATDRSKDRRIFQFFLQKKANPLKIAQLEGREKDSYYPQTVLHYVAEMKDPWYLKELLESRIIKKEDIDFEKENSGLERTAVLTALLSSRFENFKMLLDYGANVNWKSGDMTLIRYALRQIKWLFTYELLKRGAEFKNLKAPNGEFLIDSYLKDDYWPSVAINYKGVDYRQKVVQFLENHGVTDLHPWMPEDEKYVKENGRYQLYINEKWKRNPKTKKIEQVNNEDHWVRFEDSYKYDPGYKKEKAGKNIDGYEELKQKPMDYSFKKDFLDEE